MNGREGNPDAVVFNPVYPTGVGIGRKKAATYIWRWDEEISVAQLDSYHGDGVSILKSFKAECNHRCDSITAV